MGLATGQIKRVIDRSFPREQVAHLLAVAIFGVLGISGMYARQVAVAKWVSTGWAMRSGLNGERKRQTLYLVREVSNSAKAESIEFAGKRLTWTSAPKGILMAACVQWNLDSWPSNSPRS